MVQTIYESTELQVQTWTASLNHCCPQLWQEKWFFLVWSKVVSDPWSNWPGFEIGHKIFFILFRKWHQVLTRFWFLENMTTAGVKNTFPQYTHEMRRRVNLLGGGPFGWQRTLLVVGPASLFMYFPSASITTAFLFTDGPLNLIKSDFVVSSSHFVNSKV